MMCANLAPAPLGNRFISSQSRMLKPRSGGSMMVTRAMIVPDNFGLVAASVAATALMTQFLAVKVALARREYKVAYPAMYATGTSESANIFNCIQRAHQNTLEYLPSVLSLQIVMGLKFPATAGILGLAWCIGRVVYAQGYSTGDPAKRGPGSAVAGIVYLALIGGAAAAGFQMVFPGGFASILPQ